MRRMTRLSLVTLVAAAIFISLRVAYGEQTPVPRVSGPNDVTVREGTSMSVAIAPDGRTLATDMQGSIESGKLADLIMVDGDPLLDISNTKNVRRVIANGRLYEVAQLTAPRQ